MRKYFIPGCVGRGLDLDLRVGPQAAPAPAPSGNLRCCPPLRLKSTARVSLAEVFHSWVRWEGPGSGFENPSAGGALSTFWMFWQTRCETCSRSCLTCRTNPQIQIQAPPNAPRDEILPQGKPSLLMSLSVLCCSCAFSIFNIIPDKANGWKC